MFRFADCGDKPCTAIPQNPITPNRIYQESMQGKNVAQYAYSPVDNECPESDDFSIDITSRRGVDIDDLYQEQQRVNKVRENTSKTASKRYKDYKRVINK